MNDQNKAKWNASFQDLQLKLGEFILNEERASFDWLIGILLLSALSVAIAGVYSFYSGNISATLLNTLLVCWLSFVTYLQVDRLTEERKRKARRRELESLTFLFGLTPNFRDYARFMNGHMTTEELIQRFKEEKINRDRVD